MRLQYYSGIDIGGTKCAVVLGRTKHGSEICTGCDNKADDTDSIDILERIAFPTEVEKGPGHSINKIFSQIDEILNKQNIDIVNVKGMGISCGGPLDSRNGIILSPPNLDGWDNIHIVEMFEKRFGIRTRLQNDANACALAEWRFGAAKGFKNVIFLTFGTGMGAGLILDGKLYSGTNGMAGEIGHIRLESFGPVGYGKAGSFEGFCSGGGIAQLARMKVFEKFQMGEKISFCESLYKLDELNARLVGDAAEAEDELAREIYRISGYFLGKGLSILIDILNPEIIVIGSIFSRSSNLLWPEAQKVIENESLALSRGVCRVVPAGLGEKLGDYAALAVAVYE